jgi:membrane protein implicated in regulation of membrane protease activity
VTLADASTAVYIASMVFAAYDQWWRRRRDARNDRRDRRVRDLEERVAKLERDLEARPR